MVFNDGLCQLAGGVRAESYKHKTENNIQHTVKLSSYLTNGLQSFDSL